MCCLFCNIKLPYVSFATVLMLVSVNILYFWCLCLMDVVVQMMDSYVLSS
jgi:hypothetical protein